MAACKLCASQCFPLMHEHGRVLYSQGDTCMCAHMHVGLLYESVLRVWECGRRRPLACQYVLMLHIWFPNFPLSLSALPSAPTTEMSGHRFVFFRVMEGTSDEWWPWMQDITFPLSFFVCSSQFPPFIPIIFWSINAFLDLTVQWTHATKRIHICQTTMTTPPSSPFFSAVPIPWWRIKHLSGLVP